MRHRHLLALTAVAMGTTASAGAQTSRATEPSRVPEARSYRVWSSDDNEGKPRAAIGVSTSATGTLRDTLGLLITSITRNSPAEKAGLEEGNRIAAINGVSLRASAADVEDFETTGTLSRRLVRELAKAKPGDEVELRMYRDGRSQAVKVRTVDSDSLFRRTFTYSRSSRSARSEWEDRPALGFEIGSAGSRRDTLGVLVIGVQDSTPAARAGLEEGNRIAAINGVNLRVAREDAGDPSVGHAKAQRLQREVSQLKPNDNVTLRVYANGQWRDMTMKVARAGDLPHGAMMGMMGGQPWFFPDLLPSPAMAPMPPMAPRGPMPSGRMRVMHDAEPIEFELGPELRAKMEGMRADLRRMGPELRVKMDGVRGELDRMRPELEKLKMELPRLLDGLSVPDVRILLDGDDGGMTI